MDEFEMQAFELAVELEQMKKTFPRNARKEFKMFWKIRGLQYRSMTYRIPLHEQV